MIFVIIIIIFFFDEVLSSEPRANTFILLHAFVFGEKFLRSLEHVLNYFFISHISNYYNIFFNKNNNPNKSFYLL